MLEESGRAQFEKELKEIKKYDLVLAYDYHIRNAIKLELACIRNKVPYIMNLDGAFIRKNFLKNLIKRYLVTHGRNSTLFDEFMICMSSVPSRIREGMVLLSGDVLLLFNPLQIDYNNVGAAAISFKEHVETGKNHGVYLNGENGNVKCCLQKKSVEVLRSVGAVNDSNCVDIDTGALIFSTEMMESLYSLIAAPEDYDRHVNAKTRLSLYADFLYPLAEDSTLEDFY